MEARSLLFGLNKKYKHESSDLAHIRKALEEKGPKYACLLLENAHTKNTINKKELSDLHIEILQKVVEKNNNELTDFVIKHIYFDDETLHKIQNEPKILIYLTKTGFPLQPELAVTFAKTILNMDDQLYKDVTDKDITEKLSLAITYLMLGVFTKVRVEMHEAYPLLCQTLLRLIKEELNNTLTFEQIYDLHSTKCKNVLSNYVLPTIKKINKDYKTQHAVFIYYHNRLYLRAMNYLIKQKEKDTEELYLYATLLLHGKGCQTDKMTAYKTLEKAALKQHADSLFLIEKEYASVNGNNDPKAQLFLAKYYDSHHNSGAAEKWLNIAIKQNYFPAQIYTFIKKINDGNIKELFDIAKTNEAALCALIDYAITANSSTEMRMNLLSIFDQTHNYAITTELIKIALKTAREGERTACTWLEARLDKLSSSDASLVHLNLAKIYLDLEEFTSAASHAYEATRAQNHEIKAKAEAILEKNSAHRCAQIYLAKMHADNEDYVFASMIAFPDDDKNAYAINDGTLNKTLISLFENSSIRKQLSPQTYLDFLTSKAAHFLNLEFIDQFFYEINTQPQELYFQLYEAISNVKINLSFRQLCQNASPATDPMIALASKGDFDAQFLVLIHLLLFKKGDSEGIAFADEKMKILQKLQFSDEQKIYFCNTWSLTTSNLFCEKLYKFIHFFIQPKSRLKLYSPTPKLSSDSLINDFYHLIKKLGVLIKESDAALVPMLCFALIKCVGHFAPQTLLLELPNKEKGPQMRPHR